MRPGNTRVESSGLRLSRPVDGFTAVGMDSGAAFYGVGGCRVKRGNEAGEN